MREVKDFAAQVVAPGAIPLFTGDSYINVDAKWETAGQVAVQQIYPLPATIIAVVPNYQIGDSVG